MVLLQYVHVSRLFIGKAVGISINYFLSEYINKYCRKHAQNEIGNFFTKQQRKNED